MRTLAAVVLCAAVAFSSEAGPEVRSWVLTTSANAAVRAIAPDVHAVHADEDFIYVESAGLSLHSFGSLEANQYDPPLGPRQLTFRIPRHPRAAEGEHVSTPLGIIGVFVTGVPIYNPIGTASYRDQNIWHLDAVAASRGGVSPLVATLNANAARHSPIVGFALDGYPIYGPFTWGATGEIKRMTSSYRLRNMKRRTILPDGTRLTPGQEGPDVGADFALGIFAEDYEFASGGGDLDEYNGRFVHTPEYPEGTYAYFLTTWPYLIGPRYRGVPPFGGERRKSGLPVQLITQHPAAGKPTVLTLAFEDQQGRAIRFLEKIHQQPIHLIAVSDDLAEFAHIHPEPAPGDVFTVTHTFAHGGEYTLYADYTAPGNAPVVSRFAVTVAGEARDTAPLIPDTATEKTVDGVRIRFDHPNTLKAGADIPLSFALNVQDLQPWLGAWAHIMLISGDRRNFIHAHPLEGEDVAADTSRHSHTPPAAGPSPATIRTITGFRDPGIHKIWFQFQRNGIVTTVPWVVKVEAGAPPVSGPISAAALTVKVSSAGFEPARLDVRANQKTQVAFTRTDAQNCANEVVFPELDIRQRLPPGETVLIELPASRAGELHFACGMGMYRGSLVVQ